MVDDLEEIGIGSLTTFARVREQTTNTATAPVTHLEDGSFANDHIIINPVQIAIEGIVSEIIAKPRNEVQVFRRNVAEIGNISQYIPPRTVSQLSRVSALLISADDYVQRTKTAISDGQQAFDFIRGGGDPTDVVGNFIATLDALHDAKQPIRIQTKDKVFENMVITSRVTTRDNTMDDTINFKITAVQLRFTKTIFADVSKYFKKPANGQAGQQTSGMDSKGLNDAPVVEKSLASSLKSAISGLL